MSASLANKARAEPNLTPILDMVFQLITFFMLVINFKANMMDKAMELPIVATPVGAIPETIDDNGFLVSLQRPEDTVRALKRLRSDLPLRHARAARSRALSTRYDVHRMVREYEALIIEVMRERPAQVASHVEGAL